MSRGRSRSISQSQNKVQGTHSRSNTPLALEQEISESVILKQRRQSRAENLNAEELLDMDFKLN